MLRWKVSLKPEPASGATEYSYYRFRCTADNYNGDARWGLTEVYGYESNDNTGTNVFATYFLSALANSGTDSDQRLLTETLEPIGTRLLRLVVIIAIFTCE